MIDGGYECLIIVMNDEEWLIDGDSWDATTNNKMIKERFKINHPDKGRLVR